MDLVPAIRTAPESGAPSTRRVIGAVMFDLVIQANGRTSFDDLKELGKTRCARLKIPYDGALVGGELERALARFRRMGR